MSRLNLGDIIATRRLTSVGKLARHVTVRVGRISGRGVDSCQALVDALQGVHYTLERSGMRLSWAGVDGETGFPRSVPYGFGLVLAARINAYIDRELGRFVQAAKRRVKANTGRRRRRGATGNIGDKVNRPLERTGSAGRSTPKRWTDQIVAVRTVHVRSLQGRRHP